MKNWPKEITTVGTVLIENKTGLHTLPASQIAQVANRYPDKIWIQNKGPIVDAKSMLSLLQLEAEQGDRLEIRIVGKNGSEIIQQLKQLFGDSFNE